MLDKTNTDVPQSAPPIKRGPGRPPGSLNRPKEPPLSPAARTALRNELGPAYVSAILNRLRAEVHARGLKTLIRKKLGAEELAAIEAAVIVEVETGNRLADVDRAPQPEERDAA